jgi:hypothetical protein
MTSPSAPAEVAQARHIAALAAIQKLREYAYRLEIGGASKEADDLEAASRIQALNTRPVASTLDAETVALQAADMLETAIGVGYPTPIAKQDQCEHGKFGWEDCIACYDEKLMQVAAAIRALSPGKTGSAGVGEGGDG